MMVDVKVRVTFRPFNKIRANSSIVIEHSHIVNSQTVNYSGLFYYNYLDYRMKWENVVFAILFVTSWNTTF